MISESEYMTMNNRIRIAFILVVLLSTSACLGKIFGPGGSSPITDFVNGQGLHDRQAVKIIMRNDDLRLIFFKVDFGSPQDCPSGCFYSRGYGLKCREKIGWLRVSDYDYILDLETLDYFNIESTDTPLFNENVWSRIESIDSGLHWSILLPLLAINQSTPVPKLLAIALKLRNYIADYIA